MTTTLCHLSKYNACRGGRFGLVVWGSSAMTEQCQDLWGDIPCVLHVLSDEAIITP